jgi:hypothetical protein
LLITPLRRRRIAKAPAGAIASKRNYREVTN